MLSSIGAAAMPGQSRNVHYAQFGYKVTRVVCAALRLGWCNSGLLFGSEAVIISMGVAEIAGMDILWTWRVLELLAT